MKIKLIRRHVAALKRYCKKKIMRAILFPLRLFTVKKNRVMLIDNLTGNYADNPKFVGDYLSDNYSDQLEIFFAVNFPKENEKSVPSAIKLVKFNSLRYFYYCMTAKVLLTNNGGLSYIPLRKEQFVINTWHGGGHYKKSGLHMYSDISVFRKDLSLAAKQTDIFLTTCARSSEAFFESLLISKDAFWCIGMPRNDALLNIDGAKKDAVRRKIGLQDGEKLVLYAPTFRKVEDDCFKESIAISYGIDHLRVCRALEMRFGGTWKFGFRLHPRVSNREELPEGHYLNLSNYPDMQELLLAADVMINDFSSSMWDFMLTGRPSFLYAVDLEQYIRTTQVYTPVSQWPFPKAVSNDELEKNILEFDSEKYRSACMQHYKDLGGNETGHATELVCQRIYDKCTIKG